MWRSGMSEAMAGVAGGASIWGEATFSARAITAPHSGAQANAQSWAWLESGQLPSGEEEAHGSLATGAQAIDAAGTAAGEAMASSAAINRKSGRRAIMRRDYHPLAAKQQPQLRTSTKLG